MPLDRPMSNLAQQVLYVFLVLSMLPAVASAFDRIENRWKANEYLHIERGQLESGPIKPGWLSA